jgi:hypothetical protein
MGENAEVTAAKSFARDGNGEKSVRKDEALFLDTGPSVSTDIGEKAVATLYVLLPFPTSSYQDLISNPH